MCTIIEGDCGCNARSSSSGAGAALAVVAGLSAVALAGAAWQAAPWLWAFSLAAGWVAVYRGPRRAVLAGLAGVVLLVRWAVKRRRKPVTTVALPQEYKATMYVTAPDGRRRVLGTAPVPGVWTSADDVQQTVVDLWLAKHGPHPAGQIGCHATPVGQVRLP